MKQLLTLKKNVWIKLIGVLIVLALVALLLHSLKIIVIYFMISFIFAYICDPLVDWMEARKIPRTAGVAALAIGILAFLVLVWLIAIPLFSLELSRMTSDFPRYVGQFKSFLIPWLEKINIPVSWDQWLDNTEAYKDSLNTYASKLSQPLWKMISGTFNSLYSLIMGLLGVIIIPVAWFYLLRDIDPIKARIFEFVPGRHKKKTMDFFVEVDETLSNFFRGQFTVCIFLALMYIIGLEFIVDVPLGFLIGLFAGIASIVPYLGLIVGIVPALIMAALEHGDWVHPLGVVVVFTVAQVLEGSVITPKIIGDKLGMHPVTVIFSILIWGELLGFLGILIAVPVTAVLLVIVRRLVRKYFASDFFKNDAAPVENNETSKSIE